MNLQEFTQRFYQLTPKPKMVFILLMEGKTDLEIGATIAAKETTVRKHIQNLCDHFVIAVEPGEGKQQRRLRLLEQGRGYLGSLLQIRNETPLNPPEQEKFRELSPAETEAATSAESLEIINSESNPESSSEIPESSSNLRYENWEGAAALPNMLGRVEEMQTLTAWFTPQSCRLVSLVGLTGSGKTTLGVKVAQSVKADFTILCWRSLSQGPSLMELLDSWTNEILPHRSFNLVSSLTEQITQFLKILKDYRCLLILDDLETLLQPQALAGTFQPIYQDYEKFLRRVSEEEHQSCLFLLSSEKPKCLNLLEAAKLPIQSLRLNGLGKDAKILLKNQGMKQEKFWDQLLLQVDDYPQNLILVSTVIQDLFDGDVAQFLAFNASGLVEESWQLINTQLSRLSPQEWNLLYPLALSTNAFSLNDFSQYCSGSEMVLLTLLKSLHERSILLQRSGKFSLPLFLRYGVLTAIAKEIIAEVELFIEIEKLKHLKQYSLASKTNIKTNIKEKKHSPFRQIWFHLCGEKLTAIALKLQEIKKELTVLDSQNGVAEKEAFSTLDNNLSYLLALSLPNS